MPGPERFRRKSQIVEAFLFAAYTEALPPDNWNEHERGVFWVWNGYEGGALWVWARRLGYKIEVYQNKATEPAYAVIYDRNDRQHRIDIGDWVLHKGDGSVCIFKPEDFYKEYEKAIRVIKEEE